MQKTTQGENRFFKQPLLLLVPGLLGLLVFIFLLNRFFPARAANLHIGKAQAVAAAAGFLKQTGHDLAGYKVIAAVTYDVYAFAYFQDLYGWDVAREIFQKEKQKGLDFYWRVSWFKDLPKGSPYGKFNVSVSGTGEIVAFSHEIPRDNDEPGKQAVHITQDEAHEMVLAFLETRHIDLTGYKKDNFTTQRYEKRTDHLFSWIKKCEFHGVEAGKTNLTAVIRGNEVGRFDMAFGIPAAEIKVIDRLRSRQTFAGFASYIFAFILCLLIQVIFLKKYHEGEVGVKRAVIVFLICWLSLLAEAALKFRINAAGTSIASLSYDGVAIVVFVLFAFIVWPFFSIMGFGAWSVGESLGRERFNKKFTALDSVFNGRFSTLNTASSLLSGYLAGFFVLGVIALFSTASIRLFNARLDSVNYRIVSSFVPFLVPFLSALSASLLSEMVFRLFGNFFLYKYLKSKWGGIFISSFFWTAYAVAFWDINLSLSPMVWGWLLFYICGLLFGYFFWKYDLLTAVAANFTVVGVMQSLPLVTGGAASLYYPGIVSLILLFLPVVFIIRGFIKKKVFSFEADLMPAHVKRITERARMARELEIARQVQMKLLPGKPPEIQGFEIDGICIPANEVGGDYYDFIPIDDSRLAVVIGDVSGKGVPAAIYMTLTKGIIHSQAENNFSPGQVLTRVNRSLYAMMDRKSFVTLFYAVIDAGNRTLRFSRAGHNPMLYFRSGDERIIPVKPGGIALGIEKGQIFNLVIKEECIELEKGDLIVFYTDGFSEAMDKDLAQYGEKRLIEVIRQNKDKPVKEIIETVVTDVRCFTADYPQHDDMTMALIKVF